MRTHGAGRLGRPDAASPRRGVAVVMVVACLATFSLIALAMLQGSLAARGQFRSEHHLRQAELLLDAAVRRGRAQLADGGLRPLEAQWDVPADEITGSAPARLSLSVAREEGQWQLTAACSYPIEGPRAIRRSRTVPLSPAPLPEDSSLPAQENSPPPEETVP